MKNLIKCALVPLTVLGMQSCSGLRTTENKTPESEYSSTNAMTTPNADTTATGATSGRDITVSSTAQTDTVTADLFIQQAAISGMKEIEASKIAQKKAVDDKLKSFSAMMVSDHSKVGAELMALAKSKKVMLNDNAATAPLANTTSNTGNAAATAAADTTLILTREDVNTAVKQLTPLTGNKFDEIYTAMMVQDHQNAIMLFERASRSSDKEVKAFAEKHLPSLRSHLSQITEISRATGVK